MKRVTLITDGQFGENLQELLHLEGYEARTIAEIGQEHLGSFADLYIGTAELLRDKYSWMREPLLVQRPFILLSEDGKPQEDLPRACQNLQIPFSGEQLMEAIQACELCKQEGHGKHEWGVGCPKRNFR